MQEAAARGEQVEEEVLAVRTSAALAARGVHSHQVRVDGQEAYAVRAARTSPNHSQMLHNTPTRRMQRARAPAVYLSRKRWAAFGVCVYQKRDQHNIKAMSASRVRRCAGGA